MADSGNIEITGLEERIKQFDAITTNNPEMRKRVNEVIRRVLAGVRKRLQDNAASGLGMQSDPRQAYKAVRSAVYRRMFGGQVNILQKRKAGAMHFYAPPRKGTSDPKGRGGNRAKRSQRTIDLLSYTGADRGFILRFLNAGTVDRSIHSMGDRSLNRGGVMKIRTKSIGGNRGSIAPRNWFGPRSQQELERASFNIQEMIDDIIKGVMY